MPAFLVGGVALAAGVCMFWPKQKQAPRKMLLEPSHPVGHEFTIEDIALYKGCGGLSIQFCAPARAYKNYGKRLGLIVDTASAGSGDLKAEDAIIFPDGRMPQKHGDFVHQIIFICCSLS